MICGICHRPIAKTVKLTNLSVEEVQCLACQTKYKVQVTLTFMSPMSKEELDGLAKYNESITTHGPWGGKQE